MQIVFVTSYNVNRCKRPKRTHYFVLFSDVSETCLINQLNTIICDAICYIHVFSVNPREFRICNNYEIFTLNKNKK